MGNELKGAVRAGKERHEGKILLETSELIFRGTDYRLKIAFGEMRDVKAENGELVVETKDGVNAFEVGAHAEKWRDKILHPKSRAEKLGVKAGTRVRLLGEFEADFVKEVRAAKASSFRPPIQQTLPTLFSHWAARARWLRSENTPRR